MKGVYKGGPLGVLSHKVKFQQDVKIYKVIVLLKNQERLFKDDARGGGFIHPLTWRKLSTGRKNTKQHSARTDQLGRSMNAHMFEGLKNKNCNPKPKQVQGWMGWGLVFRGWSFDVGIVQEGTGCPWDVRGGNSH
jgi:hypothetical protein